MGLRIATNIAAMSTSRVLNQSTQAQTKSYLKIASGERISQAGDDPAGLSISENLRQQLRSMAQAERNANDATSLAQVAEGSLTEINNIMIRLRELGIQAGSDTVGDQEREFIHQEAKTLLEEIDRIANVTTFNGNPLLNGQGDRSVLSFQVGISNKDSDLIKYDTSLLDTRISNLDLKGINYETIDHARDALEKIDKAVNTVLGSRSSLGALQNRLQSTVRHLEVSQENFAEARSRIADTDIASEASNLVKNNIMQSAGVAVLAQANVNPGQALRLI